VKYAGKDFDPRSTSEVAEVANIEAARAANYEGLDTATFESELWLHVPARM
jgi:hypothetical protein